MFVVAMIEWLLYWMVTWVWFLLRILWVIGGVTNGV